MCFTDKRKRNWIQKEDRVPDLVRPPGLVGYGGVSRHSEDLNQSWFIAVRDEVVPFFLDLRFRITMCVSLLDLND